MKKTRECWLFIAVSLIILVFSIVNVVKPFRAYSESENKYFSPLPSANWSEMLDGRFSMKYETYVNEQFWLRDNWIQVKSVSEFLMLKTENNDVAYGRSHYLFPKFYRFDSGQLVRNLDAIDLFAYNCASDVSIMVVPTAAHPLASLLPAGLPTVDQGYYIDEIGRYLSNTTTPVDAKNILSANADKYIFYRTDHHWTTYGAWLAYSQFAAAQGLTPYEYSRTAPTVVPGFLGTSYSKAKPFNALPDTISYFDFDATLTVGGATHDGLYDLEKFSARDKYAAFLYGNHPLYQISSAANSSKKGSILVFCDSYGYSFIPFLTANYVHITVADMRYLPAQGTETAPGVQEIIGEYYDDVLFLYGFENLCNDTNFVKLLPETQPAPQTEG